MFSEGFIVLDDVESLDQLLVRSHTSPIVIFKHSDACSISSFAYAHMAKVESTVGIVTVQKARDVSDEIERRLGVAHESPQVLIVYRGSVVWSASHGRVRAEVVTAALAESVGRRQ